MEFVKSKSHPTLFEVSQNGKVRSIRSGKVLKQHTNRKGYKTIATYPNGAKSKAICVRVHRLVAECFCENPNNKKIVHHIDNCKGNNNASNLEWVTNKENTVRALMDGLLVGPKLSEDDVRVIRDVYIKGDSRLGGHSLARRFGVAPKTIRSVVNGSTWSYV